MSTVTGRALRAVLPLVVLLTTPWASAHEIVYYGRATAVNGNVTVLTQTNKILLADVGMSCNGAPREEVLASSQNPSPLSFQANEVRSAAQGVDGVARTESGMQELMLDVAGVVRIAADHVQSTAQAECRNDGSVVVDGGLTISSVSINGESVAITGEPNQTVGIPNVATITFNEQVRYSREFRVIGIRVRLADSATPVNGDVQIAAARAKIKTCDM